MKIPKAFLVAATLAAPILPPAGFAADIQWKPANGGSCDQVCSAARLTALYSGVHAPGNQVTQDKFYICATNMNGYRPGYNLKPKWSSACWVGYGGKEVAAKNYECACQ
ncbi:hypothetical protein [Xanthobacter flavus]|uniref:hypothetical protein n=1 Tax=Xanthobacter flavus TaxID=281 RepID=UPI00372AB459